MAGARVVLTEGASLTSREVVSCLGPLGYHLEVLDPDRLCLARHSRWVQRVHRCPPAGRDPLGYVNFLIRIVTTRGIDAVLPTHEQAWLLAAARRPLPDEVAVAVADADAFARVQSKLRFAQLLDELSLPQPEWRRVKYGQAQGLFDAGRLIAAHTSVQRGVGMGGSAAARLSVDHPIARTHLASIGACAA